MASTSIAQNITATITGTAKDDSRVILPSVKITIKHTETNEERHFVSDENGNFRAPLLPPGQYTLTAELAGFRSEVCTGMILQVGQIARVDFSMSVGNVTGRIEVTADVPLVSSETSVVGSVIDHTKVVELPLNGREFQQLAMLVPGVAPSVQGSSNQFRGGIRTGCVTAEGLRLGKDTFQRIDKESNRIASEEMHPNPDCHDDRF